MLVRLGYVALRRDLKDCSDDNYHGGVFYGWKKEKQKR